MDICLRLLDCDCYICWQAWLIGDTTVDVDFEVRLRRSFPIETTSSVKWNWKNELLSRSFAVGRCYGSCVMADKMKS